MRQSKLVHQQSGNGAEFALVIAALACVLTTMMYGIAAVFQGGLLPMP